MFIDQVTIRVKGGDGGDGCLSFRREKYVAKGGPDGGDGGRGGNVILKTTRHRDTLLDLTYYAEYSGQGGGHGSGKKHTGRKGEDRVLLLPIGTIVRDVATELILKDLDQDEMTVTIARGGRGGRGNRRFATPTNRTPRYAEPGAPGQERTIRLELKLIADVGLVGAPNAGKSTLLSRVSAAHPKVAAYPFTTRQPYLGIVQLDLDRRFVMADIPGLIEGAHQGAGLGDLFLRHIERTRFLLYVLDLAPEDDSSPLDTYRALQKELALYSRELPRRPHAIAANKLDLPGAQKNLRALRRAVDVPLFPISALMDKGLDKLVKEVFQMLQELREG